MIIKICVRRNDVSLFRGKTFVRKKEKEISKKAFWKACVCKGKAEVKWGIKIDKSKTEKEVASVGDVGKVWILSLRAAEDKFMSQLSPGTKCAEIRVLCIVLELREKVVYPSADNVGT